MRRMAETTQVSVLTEEIDPNEDSEFNNLIEQSHRSGISVVLSGVNPSVREVLEKNKFPDYIGNHNICSNINEALEITQVHLQKEHEHRKTHLK